jgi:predicted HTH domain antitoxin
MITLKIPLPDDIRSALSIDDEELAALALEALLVRLYERGDLSSGKVAELLRIPRREFLKLLDNYGVLIFDEDADIAAEAQHGRL